MLTVESKNTDVIKRLSVFSTSFRVDSSTNGYSFYKLVSFGETTNCIFFAPAKEIKQTHN